MFQEANRFTAMGRYKSYTIEESDLHFTIQYSRKTIKDTIIPLIYEIVADYGKRNSSNYILAIAGPPGSGKSSLAALFLQMLKKENIPAYILPLDGFHLKNEELQRKPFYQHPSITLYDRKGAKESYNFNQFFRLMEKLKAGDSFYWPSYSRKTHDPVERGIYIKKQRALYIVEGNYLLLTSEPWNSLPAYFHSSIYIHPKKRHLKRRIINRKCRGGYSLLEAKLHYKNTDSRNIDEVMKLSGGYRYALHQRRKFSFTLKRPG
jgi:pantothenate kinase